jgi:hypothetical protein
MQRAILLSMLGVGLVRVAAAQPPSGQAQGIEPLTPQRHYNGIVAGEEAYQANDARREADLGRQVNLNADMYWRWSGASSWYPGVFEAWPLVPGEIVGWPAAISPPQVSPTNVRPSPFAPLAVGQSARLPVVRARLTPVAVAAPTRPVQSGAGADRNEPSGGLLPGFVPQGEVAAAVSEPEATGQSGAAGKRTMPRPGDGARAY